MTIKCMRAERVGQCNSTRSSSLNRNEAIAIFLMLSLVTVAKVLASEPTIETIIFKDQSGNEHEEYAFRAPMPGVPPKVLDVYCASVKLRLYWGVFREAILDSARKGIYLRRMARFAKHIFNEVRDADNPFNATRLSVVDEFFAVKEDGMIEGEVDVSEVEVDSTGGESPGQNSDKSSREHSSRGIFARLKEKNNEFKRKLRKGIKDDDSTSQIEAIETSESFKELERSGSNESMKKLKAFLKEWVPKVGLGIYTRWRVMWWMMMSCLFAKYYLWDPALDEFIKLKRNLVMYPDLQLMRLQDIGCKPVNYFRRILDVCKILNPLFTINFGTLSLDKLTRFKGSDR